MDKLWSPWRSKYIDSFKDGQTDNVCIFCGMQQRDVEDKNNLLVYKDKLTFVVLNLYPYNAGHLMVVPYRHTGNIGSFSSEENSEIMMNIQLSCRALDAAVKPQGYNIGANIGRVAGAGIDSHIHYHIVPRWSGDMNFMPVLGEVKVISQDLLELKYRLIDAYRSMA
ncbi:MAG: HIT family protein [Bacteroidota bacterium]